MGGDEVAAGESILNQRRHPDVPLPRHRRPRLQRHVALQPQPPQPVRDAGAGRRRGRRRRSRRGRGPDRLRPGLGADPLDRGRIEAAARVVPHPDRADPGRRHGGAGRRPRGGTRLPRGPEAPLPDDHAQDRRRRGAAQPDRCRGGAPRLSRDRAVRTPSASAPSTSWA